MRIRYTPAVVWTLLILVLCWTPSDWLPLKESQGEEWEIPYSDKVIHAGLFAVFAFLWLNALRGERPKYAQVGLAGLALAVVSELGQKIPILKRDGEIADGLADFAGVVAGLLLFTLIASVRARRGTVRR